MTPPPVSPPVRCEVDGGIARLTLDRPDAGNGIDLAMAEALLEASTAWPTTCR